MTSYTSDVAFTPAVKAIQSRKGSRETYAHMEERGYMQTAITPELADFIARQKSMFLGSVSSDGAPYIQHRGGPPGFVHVLGPTQLGFVDYKGNRQFISQGNFAENPKAYLFMIDYTFQKRVKMWGNMTIVEGRDDLIDRLMPQNYGARPEQVMIFDLIAYDYNCPQHIPRKLDIEDIEPIISEQKQRIDLLEEEILRLQK